jgi:hypothetical protein
MTFHGFTLRALVVAAIAGPLLWLVFSEEGQRWGDATLLRLLGSPPAALNMSALSSGVREQDLRAAIPDVGLECHAQPSEYGNRVCVAAISSFNGVPARYLTFFLADEQLSALKLAYQRAYHRQLINAIQADHGAPINSDEAPQPGQPAVLRWRVGGGVLVTLDERVELDEEPALMWVASRR